MRPISVEGAGVPPLPGARPTTPASPTSTSCSGRSPPPTPANVTFVEGPDAWCADEAVATDVGMRWDGVHVYKPGAKLIYDTIAPTLLAL